MAGYSRQLMSWLGEGRGIFNNARCVAGEFPNSSRKSAHRIPQPQLSLLNIAELPLIFQIGFAHLFDSPNLTIAIPLMRWSQQKGARGVFFATDNRIAELWIKLCLSRLIEVVSLLPLQLHEIAIALQYFDSIHEAVEFVIAYHTFETVVIDEVSAGQSAHVEHPYTPALHTLHVRHIEVHLFVWVDMLANVLRHVRETRTKVVVQLRGVRLYLPNFRQDVVVMLILLLVLNVAYYLQFGLPPFLGAMPLQCAVQGYKWVFQVFLLSVATWTQDEFLAKETLMRVSRNRHCAGRADEHQSGLCFTETQLLFFQSLEVALLKLAPTHWTGYLVFHHRIVLPPNLQAAYVEIVPALHSTETQWLLEFVHGLLAYGAN